MKRKPLGWPKYMLPKPSKGGVRYFWNAPNWARKRSCPVKSEALGADYGAAKARCDAFLNHEVPMPILDEARLPDLVGVGGGTKSK
jgi:hypothetical protein